MLRFETPRFWEKWVELSTTFSVVKIWTWVELILALYILFIEVQVIRVFPVAPRFGSFKMHLFLLSMFGRLEVGRV